MGIVGKGYSYLDQSSECNYMTHIVFRLFEHLDRAPTDPCKYRVELLLSPGVSTDLSNIGILSFLYSLFFSFICLFLLFFLFHLMFNAALGFECDRYGNSYSNNPTPYVHQPQPYSPRSGTHHEGNLYLINEPSPCD